VRSRTGSGVPSRTAARIIGILILAGWFTYGPGGAITASIVAAPDTLANVAANRMTFTAGAVVMLLNSAAVVGIGVMWFPILKRHSEPVALSYLATRTLEAVFLTVGVISLLSLAELGQAHASADAAAGAHFETLSTVAVQLNDLSYQTGMATLGLGSMFFCHLLFRTGLVPRTLAAWGFIGYAVFAVGMVLDMFGFGVGLLLTIPGGLFELVFATWLIVKGFQPSATGPATADVDGATQEWETR
jgi:hypothetical protein